MCPSAMRGVDRKRNLEPIEERPAKEYLRTMWQNLMALNLTPANLIVRAGVVYIAVLILLRISGKRQMGQMGATEFVAILLISNAVQNAMNGGDNSLIGGLLLAVVLVGLSTLISFLTYRSRFF